MYVCMYKYYTSWVLYYTFAIYVYLLQFMGIVLQVCHVCIMYTYYGSWVSYYKFAMYVYLLQSMVIVLQVCQHK